EEEYQRTLAPLPSSSAPPPSGVRASSGKSIRLRNVTPSPRAMIGIVFVALLIFALALGSGAFVSMPLPEYYLRMAALFTAVALGLSLFVLVVVGVVRVIGAFYRWRFLKKIGPQAGAAPPTTLNQIVPLSTPSEAVARGDPRDDPGNSIRTADTPPTPAQ